MDYTKIRKTDNGFEFSFRGADFMYLSRHCARSERARLIQQTKGNGHPDWRKGSAIPLLIWPQSVSGQPSTPQVTLNLEWTPRTQRGANTKCKCGRKEHHDPA